MIQNIKNSKLSDFKVVEPLFFHSYHANQPINSNTRTQQDREGKKLMNSPTNKILQRKLRSFYRTGLLVLMVCASFTIINFAQERQYTGNKADQTLRSNGRVNPSTLGLEISVPLGGYPGRGIGVPISLSYSSKVWRLNYNSEGMVSTSSTCYTINNLKYGENSASGWTSSLGAAYVEYTGETNIYNEEGEVITGGELCSQPVHDYNGYMKRIQIHLPSGESHELRASDEPTLIPSSSGTPMDMTGTYYAVDGSKLKYVDDGNGTYRLYLPDGSYYDFASTKTAIENSLIRKATLYKDVNGNQLTFNAPDSTYPNGSWTDTMGRTIPIPLAPTAAPSSATVQNYYLPGITNPYKFVWKQLKGATAGDSGLTNFSDTLKYKAQATGINGVGQPINRSGSTVLFPSDTKAKTFDAIGDNVPFNPIVLTEIELPNGSKYQFSYNIYGEIDKIIYPTGGEERFTLNTVPPIGGGLDETPHTDVNRGVTERKVYENSSATPATWTYSTGFESTNFKVTTTAPNGTYSERVLITPTLCQSNCTALKWGFNTVLAGMPLEERSYSSTSQLLSKKKTTWDFSVGTNSYGGSPERHPRMIKEESIIYDPTNSSNLLSTASTMEYDGTLTDIDNPLNVRKVNQYGFSTTVGTLGTLEKSVETDFLSDSNYSAINIKSLPTETRVKDGAGNVKAKTQMFYDESGYGSGYRGLPTTVKSWTDIAGNVSIQTHAKYDSYGNVIESTDAKGNVTTTEYSATYSYAYPTKVTTPVPDSSGTNGSSTAFETTTTYDSTTGLPLTTTDANGQTTTMEYNDALLRPTKVTPPSGAGITEMIYTDTAGAMSVKTKSQIDSTNWAESTVYADGLGRTFKSEKKDNGGNVFVETEFDNLGRVKKVTNPYRTGDTKLWTENTYDDLSRVIKIKTPDNAEVTTSFELSTSGTLATVVTVTDQASKVRRSLTNGLGQLVRVDEPNDSNNLGTLTSPNQATSYAYDTLNNLTTVTQGGQTRTFSYDSASRLLQAVNPESGTIGYTYDANSNLATKTDARSIVTTYSYDNFNRVKTRSYSDSTPAVSYFYDGTGLSSVPTYSKGKLTKVSSSVSETKYTSFDNVGKLLTSQQVTDGNTYDFGYAYNLGGMLLEETYPSGRKIKNTIDTDASLSKVETMPSGGSYATRAENFSYTAAGAVSSMKLGNAKWENAQFNSRLQPTQLGLGTSSTDQSLWKVNYDYGSTDNNGNVKSQTITVPSLTAIVQNYTYDSLNRLKSATETVSSSTTWKQTFNYDRFGNRNFDAANTTTLGSCSTAQCNPTIDTANNRFTTGQGYTYDLSGNLLTDAEGRTFTYDAENKQQTVANSSTTLGTYSYDGDGKRVKKISSTETTTFVYNAGGKLVAEYLLTELTPSTPTTSYLTSDTLGSPRVVTDSSGAVISRRDFMPFGEEIAGLGGRTSGLGYQSDAVRQKFTGYERDDETDLDFAQARMYSNKLGRFSSPDPYNIVAIANSQRILVNYIKTPQIWNRFSYSLNNPLRIVDPEGLNPQSVFDYNKLSEDEKRILNNSQLTIQSQELCGPDSITLSGQDLFNHLRDNNPESLAGFLNQTAQLASITFDVNGTTRSALSFVQSVTSFAPDRIFAEVDPQLKTLVANDDRFSDVLGHTGHPDSWKDNRPLRAGIQLSFNRQGNSADIDTDLWNIAIKTRWWNPKDLAIKSAAIAGHAVEVGENDASKGKVTNPYKVYELLRERGIKVNYSIQ